MSRITLVADDAVTLQDNLRRLAEASSAAAASMPAQEVFDIIAVRPLNDRVLQQARESSPSKPRSSSP